MTSTTTSTVIERTRQVHQDLLAHESKLLDTLLIPTTTPKDRLFQEHTVHQQFQSLLHLEKQLLSLYQDADGTRARELEYISGDQAFTHFYEEVRQLRDYFLTKASNVVAVKAVKSNIQGEEEVTPESTSQWNESSVTSLFTAEESYGRHVDMHIYYERYINLPQFKPTSSSTSSSTTTPIKPIDYITFLKTFHQFDKISRDTKLKSFHAEGYKKWVEDVVFYLSDFHHRVHPLVNMDKLNTMIREEFDKLWNEKKIVGWFDGAGEVKQGDSNDGSSQQQDSNPLYCKACAKLFAKDSVFKAHLDGKAHKKAIASQSSTESNTKRDSTSRSLAYLEYQLQTWYELLQGIITDTIAHITEKQTKTYEEIMAEEERAIQQATVEQDEDSDEDENKPIYNPLNLPLGWDGKPIPFWLYKLHGLNIEYVCEICGNHSYFGPRNWERHFKEWRHAFGMRCLGIPNTKHFVNIAKMDQAKALYEKLKKEWATSGFKPDEEEEFEDPEGNVFNKKTYEDLKRQGLI